MTESKLVDSSVWLAYFMNGTHAENIDSSEVFLISTLSLFEIKRKLQAAKTVESKVIKAIKFMKKKSIIIQVTIEIAEHAADIASKHGLPAVDSLIYATAVLNNAIVITMDNDFRGLSGTQVISE